MTVPYSAERHASEGESNTRGEEDRRDSSGVHVNVSQDPTFDLASFELIWSS